MRILCTRQLFSTTVDSMAGVANRATDKCYHGILYPAPAPPPSRCRSQRRPHFSASPRRCFLACVHVASTPAVPATPVQGISLRTRPIRQSDHERNRSRKNLEAQASQRARRRDGANTQIPMGARSIPARSGSTAQRQRLVAAERSPQPSEACMAAGVFERSSYIRQRSTSSPEAE